jgi:predicted NAD-dependent protein-ADP-ribosyltransferase YbiA (DUF1768 family)
MEETKGPVLAAPAAAGEGEVAVQPEPQTMTVPPLDQVNPYDAATEAKIIMFFKKRSGKLIGQYTYTAAGDLTIKVPGKEGDINLKRFLPLEPAEQAAMDELRIEGIAELETQLEAANQTLREAIASYKTSGSIRPVLEANQAVADLDARRAAIRSGVRAVITMGNPVTRDILFEQRYETRKLLYTEKGSNDPFEKEFYRLIFREFPPSRLFGKYVADEAVPAAEAEAKEAEPGPDELLYRQKLSDGRMARIFFRQDADVNGFLSPFWPVEFTLDTTRYFTAYQAYEAERMRELNKEDVRATLLRSRNVNTIRVLTKKIEGAPKDPKGLWLKIFTAVYQQHEELQEKLLATGTDTLVFADDRAGPSGIGLSEASPAALKPTAWRGENAVGVALETIRTRLREGSLEEAPEGEVEEAVISEAEQEKNRVGAIINARRGGGSGGSGGSGFRAGRRF